VNPEQAIQPINIAGATFLVQFLLVAVLIIGVYIINAGLSSIDTSRNIGYKNKRLGQIQITSIAIGVLISFAALLISDSFFSTWSPVFQGIGINTISTKTSVAVVFAVDLAVVTYLIWLSGGVDRSPFTSILFTLPALAIFLRLEASAFIWCAIYSGAAYLFILYFYTGDKEIEGQHSKAFVNISCLGLSILTGYITRPVAI
jgi:hypothetical protein